MSSLAYLGEKRRDNIKICLKNVARNFVRRVDLD